MLRDPDLQAQFLRDAETLAGWHDDTLERLAAERLEQGAREYGEDGWLEADCIKEAMEEAVDGAGGWCALEHQKNALRGDERGKEELAFAAAHFIMAYRRLADYLAERE